MSLLQRCSAFALLLVICNGAELRRQATTLTPSSRRVPFFTEWGVLPQMVFKSTAQQRSLTTGISIDANGQQKRNVQKSVKTGTVLGKTAALLDGEEKARKPSMSAVIVEPRCVVSLALAVANLHARLPKVPVQVFYGATNTQFVDSLRDSLQDLFEGVSEAEEPDWLTLSPLPGEFFNRDDYEGYSALFETTTFWDLVLGEQVLVFNTDSWICKDATKKVKRFMQYDYVGAPWAHFVPGCGAIGNGGLSLRRTSTMRSEVAFEKREAPYAPVEAEDVFFCKLLSRNSSAKLPSDKEANAFSYEEKGDGSNNPFGTHKPWNSFGTYSWSGLERNCEDIHMMVNAQSKSKHSDCSSPTLSESVADVLNEYRDDARQEYADAVAASLLQSKSGTRP